MSNTYIKATERVLEKANREMDKIAKRFRDNVMLPICQELDLDYMAGMGSTTFYLSGDPHQSIRSAEDAEDTGYSELEDIFEVLNTEGVGTNDCLGFHVEDILLSRSTTKPHGG